jgi:GNAT superfamily N-acetyltransferase
MSLSDVDITVSPADVDGEALFALLHESYAYMAARIDPPSSLLAMSPDDLLGKAASETLIAAHAARELIGCMFCRREAEWLYVGKLAVAAPWRRHGVAQRMFAVADELATTQDLLGLELETRIELTENHRAFATLGFSIVEENAHAGYDRPTSVRMRKPL